MKVFMIGAGDIAKSHARAVVKLGGEVIGAYDVSQTGLEAFAREFYCDKAGYEQLDEYIAQSDYVVISTPPTKRIDYVEKVLSAHVPLYMEKPIATTLEDANTIADMAKKYDGKIIVGFAHRFRPAYVKMYDMVKSGMFGEPVNVFSYRVGPGFGYGKNNAVYGNSWRTDPKLACGMTIESVSHEFNLLTALAGEFDTIACNVKGTIDAIPQYDTNSSIIMRCKNGAIASIMTSWSSGAGANIKGYIGTKGSILLKGRNMFEFDSITYKTVDMDHEETINFFDSYDLNKDEVIYNIHKHFWDCLLNGAEIITPLSEGMKVLRLSLTALEASKEQKTIALGDYYTL
jgi:myo-inositol 2-dehydrogenase/D-chiro-inositol 1-dehydrogenase